MEALSRESRVSVCVGARVGGQSTGAARACALGIKECVLY